MRSVFSKFYSQRDDFSATCNSKHRGGLNSKSGKFQCNWYNGLSRFHTGAKAVTLMVISSILLLVPQANGGNRRTPLFLGGSRPLVTIKPTHGLATSYVQHDPILRTSSVTEFSRKQLLRFINSVRKESLFTQKTERARFLLIYQKLLDIALADIDATVRSSAVHALEEIGLISSNFYRPLATALAESSTPPSVKQAIAQYLGTIKADDPRVFEGLVLALLHSNKHFVRKAAATALGALKPSDNIIFKKLTYVALFDKNGGVKREAKLAIQNILGPLCPKAFLPPVNRG